MTEHAQVVTAELRPELGGKIVALTGAGVQWLLPAAAGEPRVGAGFVDAGLSGWDECLPTIDPCVLGGALLADHGELWSQRWAALGDGWYGASVGSPRLEFARRVAPYAGGLRLDYRVTNPGDEPVHALWAAHPQFLAPPGTRVELAAGTVLEVHPRTERAVQWRDVCGIDHVPAGAARKFYLPADARVSSARLVRPDGRWLRLSWDATTVPHLGVWFDSAAYAHSAVIAIEPGIGWYDALDRAVASGTALHLAPGASRHWLIDVRAGAFR